MSVWRVRHEGSPRSVERPVGRRGRWTGCDDGRWEPTDEVRGRGDADWQPLEDHPQFAEAVADMRAAAAASTTTTRRGST